MDETRPPLRRDAPRYWAWAISLMVAAGSLLFVARLAMGLAPPGGGLAPAAVAASGGLLAVLSGAGLLASGWPRGGSYQDPRKPLYAFGGIVLVGVGVSLLAWAVRLA